MDLLEYEKVKSLSYLEYCDYLQKKYGIGLCNYMTKSWWKNKKATRTSEGLYCHHKFENQALLLSHREYAMQYPYEWQMAENLVYCDLLEHLFLHFLIGDCGSPGVVVFLIPELNDLYSGWKTEEPWRKICHEKVINDKDVYMKLLKRIKEAYKKLF